jgi:hypothetical protein
MNLDEEFAGQDGEYEDMWRDINIALDEVDLVTLDRVVAQETFDGLVGRRRKVSFRFTANPAKLMPGFKTVFTYVFPCHHLSCSCQCKK